MLVDGYEKYNNDRQDVVDINTDEPVGDAEPELMADDCTSTSSPWKPPSSSLFDE